MRRCERSHFRALHHVCVRVLGVDICMRPHVRACSMYCRASADGERTMASAAVAAANIDHELVHIV